MGAGEIGGEFQLQVSFNMWHEFGKVGDELLYVRTEGLCLRQERE